jgi:hypothetical protein
MCHRFSSEVHLGDLAPRLPATPDRTRLVRKMDGHAQYSTRHPLAIHHHMRQPHGAAHGGALVGPQVGVGSGDA